MFDLEAFQRQQQLYHEEMLSVAENHQRESQQLQVASLRAADTGDWSQLDDLIDARIESLFQGFSEQAVEAEGDGIPDGDQLDSSMGRSEPS